MSKFRCSECGYESPRWFGVCPNCKQGVGEEVPDVVSKDEQVGGSTFGNVIPQWTGPSVKERGRRVDPNAPSDNVVKTTPYPGLNAILSTEKGFVEAQVCLLGASPGVGKSTLCMSIADSDTLYVSSEENFNQVNKRALRVNPNSGCVILNTTSISEILSAIRTCEQKLVIIDSLNSIEFGVGYSTVARFAHEITQAVKETKKVGIIISQVAKNGEISGMNSIIHVVDTVLHLERSETSGNVIAVSSKNRFGEIGEVAMFRHEADGFAEVEIEEKSGIPEIGCTYTDTRFGHKVMTIALEALVAESQSAFGIRKANGYSANRLMQLVGVLSYYGKIDLVKKDIYVAVSNGLYTDDISVELAIANSILSCCYGVSKVQKAYGEVRLNGRVINGYVDGEPIKHIDELVEKYKSGGKHV